jgi:ATP adenylyltransferase
MAQFADKHRPSADRADLFEAIGRSADDERNLVVWRGVRVFVVMNLYPYNNGHVLVIPFRRVERYQDLTPEERIELADVIGYAIDWIDEALSPEGYNVGLNLGKAAGAGIPKHLHVHVVPRWSGDTNFMPSIADVKVVPQAIEETFRRLRSIADRSKQPT